MKWGWINQAMAEVHEAWMAFHSAEAIVQLMLEKCKGF